jgi:hypothetical protein
MGYHLNRFSPLKQINKDNVKHLVPVWNYSYDDNRSEESQPLVYKGVLYVTTDSATMAIDAKTRQATLEDQVEYPPETPRIVCCGIINRRGAAIYDGKIFRTTLDANVIALDAKTSKELFARTRSTSRPDPSSTAGIPRGVSICGAPTRSPDRASPAVTPSRETPGRMGAARPGSPARSIPSCTPVLGHRQSGSVQRHRQGRATISTPVQCWRSIPRRER